MAALLVHGQSCCEAQGRPQKTIAVNAQLNLECHFAVVAMLYLDHSRHLSERFLGASLSR
jgi:hypothetical protein